MTPTGVALGESDGYACVGGTAKLTFQKVPGYINLYNLQEKTDEAYREMISDTTIDHTTWQQRFELTIDEESNEKCRPRRAH